MVFITEQSFLSTELDDKSVEQLIIEPVITFPTTTTQAYYKKEEATTISPFIFNERSTSGVPLPFPAFSEETFKEKVTPTTNFIENISSTESTFTTGKNYKEMTNLSSTMPSATEFPLERKKQDPAIETEYFTEEISTVKSLKPDEFPTGLLLRSYTKS